MDADFDGQYDDMLAFFMNCFHLKDWIIQDFYVEEGHPNHSKFCDIKKEVEQFIWDKECLRLCADICNGAKHYRLKNLRLGEATKIRTEIHLDETVDILQVKRIWTITSESGKEWNSFELATECMTTWRDFLNSNQVKWNQLMNYPLPERQSETDISTLMKGNLIGSERIIIQKETRNSK